VADATPFLDKVTKIGSFGSFVLAAALMVSSFVGKNAVNAQTVQTNTQTIQELRHQLDVLQQQVSQQQVIANEVRNVKEQVVQTNSGLNRLSDELHAWQREERRLHSH